MSLWNGEHLPKHVKDNDLNNALEACRLLTTKPDSKNHGLGLRNIEVCAEKYYGKTEVTVREDEFELAVSASGTNRIIDTIYDTMYNISRRV